MRRKKLECLYLSSFFLAILIFASNTVSLLPIRSPIEQHALRNANNRFNTNTYSYLETSGGQSSNVYLNAVNFFQRQCLLDICAA